MVWELPENSNLTLSAPPRLCRVRESGGDRILQNGKSYPAALPAASSVCRGCVATTKEWRREFLQRLLPDQRQTLEVFWTNFHAFLRERGLRILRSMSPSVASREEFWKWISLGVDFRTYFRHMLGRPWIVGASVYGDSGRLVVVVVVLTLC